MISYRRFEIPTPPICPLCDSGIHIPCVVVTASDVDTLKAGDLAHIGCLIKAGHAKLSDFPELEAAVEHLGAGFLDNIQ